MFCFLSARLFFFQCCFAVVASLDCFILVFFLFLLWISVYFKTCWIRVVPALLCVTHTLHSLFETGALMFTFQSDVKGVCVSWCSGSDVCLCSSTPVPYSLTEIQPSSQTVWLSGGCRNSRLSCKLK